MSGRPAARPWKPAAALALVLLAMIVPAMNYYNGPTQSTLLVQPPETRARQDAEAIAALIPSADRANFRISVSADLPDFKMITHGLANRDLRALRGDIHPQSNPKFTLLYFPTPAVASLYGVKYLVLPASARQVGDVEVNPRIVLRTDPSAMPRVFFVQGGLQLNPSPVDALPGLAADGTRPVLVASKDLPAGFRWPADAGQAPSFAFPVPTHSDAVRIELPLLASGAGLLILNEDPGGRWRAFSGSTQLVGFRVNGFQTAFAIPSAGRYAVRIERPSTLF